MIRNKKCWTKKSPTLGKAGR